MTRRRPRLLLLGAECLPAGGICFPKPGNWRPQKAQFYLSATSRRLLWGEGFRMERTKLQFSEKKFRFAAAKKPSMDIPRIQTTRCFWSLSAKNPTLLKKFTQPTANRNHHWLSSKNSATIWGLMRAPQNTARV